MHREQREQMLMQGYLQAFLDAEDHTHVPALGSGYFEKTINLTEFSLVAATALYQISESQPDLHYPGTFWYEVPQMLWNALVTLLKESNILNLDYEPTDKWDALLEAWKDKVMSVFWTWIATEGR